MTDTRDRYLAARDRLHALVDGLDDDALNAKPAPDAWSAAECVVHLNKTHKQYLPVIEEAIEAARAAGGPRGQGPVRHGFFARRFIEGMKPDGPKVPTASGMKPPATDGPSSDIDRERAVARFDDDIDRFAAAIDAADGLDLGRIKMRSPFLALIRLPVASFLELLSWHAHRHVAQAERAVEAAVARAA